MEAIPWYPWNVPGQWQHWVFVGAGISSCSVDKWLTVSKELSVLFVLIGPDSVDDDVDSIDPEADADSNADGKDSIDPEADADSVDDDMDSIDLEGDAAIDVVFSKV